MAELTLRIVDADFDAIVLHSMHDDDGYVVVVTCGHAGDGPDGWTPSRALRRCGLTLEDLEALADYASTVAAARRCAEYRLQADG